MMMDCASTAALMCCVMVNVYGRVKCAFVIMYK